MSCLGRAIYAEIILLSISVIYTFLQIYRDILSNMENFLWKQFLKISICHVDVKKQLVD